MPTDTKAIAKKGEQSLAPLHEALEELRNKFGNPPARGGVTAIEHFPQREARLAPFP